MSEGAKAVSLIISRCIDTAIHHTKEEVRAIA